MAYNENGDWVEDDPYQQTNKPPSGNAPSGQPKAQAYNNPGYDAAGTYHYDPSVNHDVNFWQSQGFKPGEIVNDQGQTQGNWQKTATGYELPPPSSGAPAAAPQGQPAPAASPVAQAYQGYLGAPAPQPPAQPGMGESSALLDYLKGQQGQQNAQQAAMRELMMGRLKSAQEPVSTTSPGIREVIAAQRLSGQRSAERQRSQLAARLGSQNLSSSGAMDTGMNAIEQQRGEADMRGTAGVLGHELDAKRQEIQQLIQLAVQSGDAESARTLQAELQTIEGQMQQGRFSASQAQQQNQWGYDFGLQSSEADANRNFQAWLQARG